MKTIENVTIYKCDFCKKELKRKYAMINHENSCNCNPDNFKACTSGCVHLEHQQIDVEFESYYDWENGEQNYTTKKVNSFRCAKFDKLMFPYQIEKKDLQNRFPDTFENQEPMPKQCDDFSDDVINAPWNF
jgi:hypothetical protein